MWLHHQTTKLDKLFRHHPWLLWEFHSNFCTKIRLLKQQNESSSIYSRETQRFSLKVSKVSLKATEWCFYGKFHHTNTHKKSIELYLKSSCLYLIESIANISCYFNLTQKHHWSRFLVCKFSTAKTTPPH